MNIKKILTDKRFYVIIAVLAMVLLLMNFNQRMVLLSKLRGQEKTRESFVQLLGEAFRAPTVQPAWRLFIALLIASGQTAFALAKDSDQLFIEAAFLEKDKDIARQKQHLTAWQAGTLAAGALPRATL